jgi:hypothetical protein
MQQLKRNKCRAGSPYPAAAAHNHNHLRKIIPFFALLIIHSMSMTFTPSHALAEDTQPSVLSPQSSPPLPPGPLIDPAQESLLNATGPELMQAEGHVVKVATETVYVDRGGLDGVVPGKSMTLLETIDITDMDGKPIGKDYREIGELRVKTAGDHLSSTEVAHSERTPERGMLVRYMAPKPLNMNPNADKTLCPMKMQLVRNGSFTFSPGALANDTYVDQAQVTEETDNFCVDITPQEDLVTWREARDFCGAMNKRLCTRPEQHKICALHNRKPPCSREDSAKGTCARGEAVTGFDRMLEWSAAWTETDKNTGIATAQTGSCSCSGIMPACSICYYPECRGVKKRVRCCADPD